MPLTSASCVIRGQRLEDFLDEDELAEAAKTSLQATAAYDTFGSTAAELAKRAAAAETSGAGLSLVPDEIIAPVADSMGAPAPPWFCVS